MVSIHASSEVGRVIGARYRLLAPLGQGASAQVYLAEDTVLGRRVAIKMLQPELARDEAFVGRFRAEARTLSTLSHPNIVVVYDRQVDEVPYLVTEYLAGGSLRGMFRAGHRLTLSQALAVGLDACRALTHAHGRNVIHRDLTPANLLFGDDGRLRIADFGVARVIADHGMTLTGTDDPLVGTMRYASPEQADGVPSGPASDVYALALVLIEAVTGTVPFDGTDPVASLRARTLADLEVPAEMGPLRAALRRAGRRDPEARADAEELGIALLAASERLPAPDPLPLVGALVEGAGEPIPDDEATALALSVDASPSSARRKWPFVLVAALLAVVVAAGAVVALDRATTTPSEPVPVLAGRSVDDVALLADSAGWTIEERRVRRDGTEPGEIVATDPDAGVELAEGETLIVFVSLGNELTDRPEDLVDRPLADVLVDIERAGLESSVTEVYDETIAVGNVIGTDGPIDSRPPRGTIVPLLVSLGPAPRTIPSFPPGSTFTDVAEALRGLGLTVIRVDHFNDNAPVGQALAVSPSSGSEVPFGSEVTVDVSKGPDVVTVPALEGMRLDEAERALVAAGLVLGQDCCASRGRVVGSDPPSGSVVRRGSAVNVFLAR